MGLKELQNIREHRDDPKPVKKYVIPKVSKKRQKKLAEQKDLAKLDEEFYKEVWLASPNKCQNCDLRLPRTPSNWMFHHVLFKSKRPDLRHVHENIMLLCLECHDQVHRNPDKCPKINRRAEELEKLFPL